MPHRTFLFVPGSNARQVEKALGLHADAVILDLEDAVAISEKRATRGLIVQALQRPRRSKGYVRINAMDTEFCYGDLVTVIGPGLDGIVLPKIETAADLLAADWLITQLERERGLPARSIELMPIVETGRGIDNARELAQAGSRVRRFAFGAGDFTTDMNVTWSGDERECEYARYRLATASRAAGIEAPIDSVYARLNEPEGLKRSATFARTIGFQGKMCIHPDQISVINDIFSPSDAEITFSQRVVAAFTAAEREGKAAIQLDGKLIDYPILYRAQRVLEAAREITESAA